jgi:hypothetical protein
MSLFAQVDRFSHLESNIASSDPHIRMAHSNPRDFIGINDRTKIENIPSSMPSILVLMERRPSQTN